jgi:hypothetical protein
MLNTPAARDEHQEADRSIAPVAASVPKPSSRKPCIIESEEIFTGHASGFPGQPDMSIAQRKQPLALLHFAIGFDQA